MSEAGAAQVQEGDVRVPELASLPGAGAARADPSKLFHSAGPARAKPVHRVIAEFPRRALVGRPGREPARAAPLARAIWRRWCSSGELARHARLARLPQPGNGPEQVVGTTHFGLFVLAETASLTVQQADCLFNALCELAKNDPFFRAADWDAKTVSGLMIPALRDRIDAVIGSACRRCASAVAADRRAESATTRRRSRERPGGGDSITRALLPRARGCGQSSVSAP